MEINTNSIRIFLNKLVPVVILLTGCSLSRSNGFPNADITTQIVDKTITPVATEHEFHKDNQFLLTDTIGVEDHVPEENSTKCKWPPVKITERARVFYWTPERTLLAFTEDVEKGEWLAYDFENKKTKSYTPDETYIYEHTIGQLTTEENKAIANKYKIEKFQELYESSINQMVLYGLLDDMSDYQLFSKEIGDHEPTYLGKIRGNIDRVYWFKDGQRVLLAIDWQSAQGIGDGYIYIMDLTQSTFDIVIPNNPEYRNTTYFGITPNEEKILFVTYAGHDRSLKLWDINTNEVKKTPILAPFTLNWLSNAMDMVGVSNLEGKGPFVFRYNIKTQRLTRLMEAPLPLHPDRRWDVQFSPDLRYLGFIHEMDNGLYILDCSNLNLQ
jgi:WD40 repeat protein